MIRPSARQLFILIASCTIPGRYGFHVALPTSISDGPMIAYPIIRSSASPTIRNLAVRYGPGDLGGDSGAVNDEKLRQQQQNDDDNEANTMKALEELVNQIMLAKQEHIPSLLGNNVELVINLQSYQLEALLEQAYEKGGTEWQHRVAETVEVLVGFAEAFVLELKQMDDVNKQLLGKIIRTISSGKNEEELDDLLEREKEHFSPGFLRHLEGECERIANAPSTTTESMKLMQVLRTIQARVVEELGKEMGEGALVLGQLLGYDNPQERLAVLQAGLQLRGQDFGRELLALTEEALQNFARVNADPELVDRVRDIHRGIQDYLKIQP